MLRLRILDILKEQNHTKYWLYKQMDMSYQNLNRILNNETTSIRFDILEQISDLLGCPVGDLFEKIETPDDKQN
ncbi:MAG: helix-turn-helix transcriptional regulator [Clostridiales bacterium]|nr:helix-turn-helix transcriptional regulator [Clostridiales bacterium]